jgi:transcriptional regulator with XRE-family HTH domain
MDFRTLQDALRQCVINKIARGELTGSALAKAAGFRQAHISNFLNRRRGLSLEAMDRILKIVGLTVVDLVDPAALRATLPLPSEDDYDDVLLVSAVAAISQPVIVRSAVSQVLKFKKSFLRRLRPEMASAREHWTRFVLVKADSGNGLAMQPRMTASATLLIDRHYNSLRPYRRRQPNMYAIDKSGNLLVRYVELQEAQLLLRPHNQQAPLASIVIRPGKSFADYIIGRVCHVAFET